MSTFLPTVKHKTGLRTPFWLRSALPSHSLFSFHPPSPTPEPSCITAVASRSPSTPIQPHVCTPTSLLLEAEISQVWLGGKCRSDINAGTDDGDRSDKGNGKRAPPSPSLSGSGLPGKNGPKLQRRESAIGRRGADPKNPWLAGGIGRMGRCRCCS